MEKLQEHAYSQNNFRGSYHLYRHQMQRGVQIIATTESVSHI